MLTELILFAVTTALCFYLYQRRAQSYWQRHNVKFVQPRAFFGNLRDLFLVRKPLHEVFNSFYNDANLKGNEPVVGIYNCFSPALLIRDVSVIKRVMIKDFNDFSDRVIQADPYHDPLGSYNLFFALNPSWRELRSKLSPIFTSGKIKQMYPLMTEVGREYESLLQTFSNGSAFNVKQISSRFTNELISTIAFGIRTTSLYDPNDSFYRHILAINEPTLSRAIDAFCLFMLPALTSLLRIKLIPKKTASFMRREINHIIAERERTRATRPDLIDALITMKQEAKANPDKPNPARDSDFLVAQSILFHTAGFETSSSTMTFALYELALHPALQERLRSEILDAFDEENNERKGVSYEKLQAMPYLGQVVDETLRKYPIVGVLDRKCTPAEGKKGVSLTPHSDFVIPPGMAVYIPVYAVHHDEQYWPEPHKFDPERFAPENRKNLNMDAYMPFGTGPRNCIGMRIGLLQTKLGLVHLLKNFRVEPCENTPKVIEFDKRTPALSSNPDIELKLISVTN